MSNASGTAYRHYIPAGNNFIVYTRLSTGTNATYYVTKDHLGSSAVITDQTGNSLGKETFAALGWAESSTNIPATVSRHEFTGQEELDNVGLINMNGRVYQPSGSYFLSPDPHITDPTNPQNYNRYSYVNNNPLTYVDPTGYDCTFTTIVTPGSDGIGEIGPDGVVLPITVTGSTSITTLSGCGDLSSFAARFGNGGGGGGGSKGPPAKPANQAQRKTGCDQVLPNGKTVGDVVRQQRAQLNGFQDPATQFEAGGDPLPATFGTFVATVLSNGPIDFKNNFRGSGNAQALGNAGNFAYYGIGTGILPNSLLDFGAGLYGVRSALLGKRPFADLTGRDFSDSSAASVRDAALASDGCQKK
jgi:RHS repeat-associated protein